MRPGSAGRARGGTRPDRRRRPAGRGASRPGPPRRGIPLRRGCARRRRGPAARRPGRRAAGRAYSFMAEPQPAAFTTTVSTPASSKTSMVDLAKRIASSSRPAWPESAPQQPCPAGTTTSNPSAASTRAVAAFTSEKKTACTQPVRSPTVPRRVPCARTCPARRSTGPQRGAIASIRRSGPGTSRAPIGERTKARSPLRSVAASAARAHPQAPRIGEEGEDGAPRRPLGAAPGARRSTWARVASISLSYCTPDGQAVTQAMHDRQRSKCSTAAGPSSAPSSTCSIRWIRPLGESISSPQTT